MIRKATALPMPNESSSAAQPARLFGQQQPAGDQQSDERAVGPANPAADIGALSGEISG